LATALARSVQHRWGHRMGGRRASSGASVVIAFPEFSSGASWRPYHGDDAMQRGAVWPSLEAARQKGGLAVGPWGRMWGTSIGWLVDRRGVVGMDFLEDGYTAHRPKGSSRTPLYSEMRRIDGPMSPPGRQVTAEGHRGAPCTQRSRGCVCIPPGPTFAAWQDAGRASTWHTVELHFGSHRTTRGAPLPPGKWCLRGFLAGGHAAASVRGDDRPAAHGSEPRWAIFSGSRPIVGDRRAGCGPARGLTAIKCCAAAQRHRPALSST